MAQTLTKAFISANKWKRPPKTSPPAQVWKVLTFITQVKIEIQGLKNISVKVQVSTQV